MFHIPRSATTPLQSSLSDFYDSMSQTAKKAASLVNRPTKDYARDLRRSLEQTMRSVDRLAEAIEPTHDSHPAQLNGDAHQ